MSTKELAFKEINYLFKDSEISEMEKLWDFLNKNVFPITRAPYPVSHGADHIANVIVCLSKLVRTISLERVSGNFKDNLKILYFAAIIHDVNMRNATLYTNQSVDEARKQHSDYSLLLEFAKEYNILENQGEEINKLICYLASSHASSLDRNGNYTSVEDKTEKLELLFRNQYPDIALYSMLLQFSDLLDIRESRLNIFNPNDYQKSQYKHYLKHKLFTTDIDEVEKKIRVILNEVPIALTRIEIEKLRKEICLDIKMQFERLKSFLPYGWELCLPEKVSSTIEYPEERRIRIQTSVWCDLRCHNCHDDQLNINCRPNDDRLVKLICNIKNDPNANTAHPQPNRSFTLTGGEPFKNDRISDIIQASSSSMLSVGEINTTFLLTNAQQLNGGNRKILKDNNLYNLRISLNYEEGIENNSIEDETSRIGNIRQLIQEYPLVKIRINHVLKQGNEQEVHDFIAYINSKFSNNIPKNIIGIGFIQDSKCSSYDITKLANDYVERYSHPNEQVHKKARQKIWVQGSGFSISFIKLNCDVNNDLIKRCFMCVREQDINISADTRIRSCSGWDENFHPIFKDAQFDVNSPLTGISSVIRNKYGVAGFYGHFPFIVKSLITNINTSNTSFNFNQLNIFLHPYLSVVQDDDFESIILKLISSIANLETPFKQLFKEGIVKETEIDNTVILSELLLKAGYQYASVCNRDDLVGKSRVNQILLLLAYFAVDESLFSSGRTIIVRGMSLELLNKISNGDYKKNNEDLLIFSTYCISTIALENIEAEKILSFINFMLNDEQKIKYSQIPYLIGCIHRQAKNKIQAIEAFNTAFSRANIAISTGNSEWLSLNKEIRAESQRSLGAIKKTDMQKADETQNHFLQAHYFSTIDNTKLSYASLYSEGYASMLQFFSEEYGKNNKFIIDKFGFKAYIQMEQSLKLNATFYAPLIRISLLDLAFKEYQKAWFHIEKAGNTFLEKGLLTDQEYINKIMSNFIYLYTHFKLQGGRQISINILNEYLEYDIDNCTIPGIRDFECVIEDVKILEKIIFTQNTKPFNDSLTKIVNEMSNFTIKCNQLVISKSIKKANQLKNDINNPEINDEKRELLKKEIEELISYDFLQTIKSRQISINDFHHICIQTDNYKESLQFYTEYLGGKIILENSDFHLRAYNTWLLLGGIKIELQTAKKGKGLNEWSDLNSGPVHFCFVVRDVQQMYNDIQKAEIKLNLGITFKKKNNSEVYVVDGKGFKIFKVNAPEGTEIEIRENPNID